MRKSKFFTLFFFCSFLFFNTLGQQKQGIYSSDVEQALKKAGKNRKQLEIVISHFRKKGNELQLKAAYFLISNMDIHYSKNYYWRDVSGSRVDFDETNYTDWPSALKAFEMLKKKHGKLEPVEYTYGDLQTLTAKFLIDNIERAFATNRYQINNQAAFSNFCEYVLPYRIANEPVQNWRELYRKRFLLSKKLNLSSSKQFFPFLKAEYDKNFVNSFSIEDRIEPLPYLGAQQILLRKKGLCEDIAALEVFILRSNGFPATTDVVVNWATSSGAHTLNATFDQRFRAVPFDILNQNFTAAEKLYREPGKVIRITYSAQRNTLVEKVDTTFIPRGFMRTSNYIDVTREYWRVNDITCNLNPRAISSKKAFICVFNYSKWRPVWWSVIKNNSATFTDMAKGSVFLPAYYEKGKIIPAAYPVVNGQHRQHVLKPDLLKTHTVKLLNQNGYLVYRPGRSYRLYYWDNEWKLLAKQTATNLQKSMSFEKVPTNALLLLRPDYSEKKERPFAINEKGERLWF